MEVTRREQIVRDVFDQVDVAIQDLERRIADHGADAGAVGAALNEFQQAWDHFLADWGTAMELEPERDTPFADRSAVPALLMQMFGLLLPASSLL